MNKNPLMIRRVEIKDALELVSRLIITKEMLKTTMQLATNSYSAVECNTVETLKTLNIVCIPSGFHVPRQKNMLGNGECNLVNVFCFWLQRKLNASICLCRVSSCVFLFSNSFFFSLAVFLLFWF